MKNKQGRGKIEEGERGRKGKEDREERDEYLGERKCEEWGGESYTKLHFAKKWGEREREGEMKWKGLYENSHIIVYIGRGSKWPRNIIVELYFDLPIF